MILSPCTFIHAQGLSRLLWDVFLWDRMLESNTHSLEPRQGAKCVNKYAYRYALRLNALLLIDATHDTTIHPVGHMNMFFFSLLKIWALRSVH